MTAIATNTLTREYRAAIDHAIAWTGATVWPVDTLVCAARFGVRIELVESNDEFLRVVGDCADDRVWACVPGWAPFVNVHGVLAVHCAQRLLRHAGLDAERFELVAHVCYALTGYVAERSALNWTRKIASFLPTM